MRTGYGIHAKSVVMFVGIRLAGKSVGGCLLVIGGLFHGVVVACRGVSLEGFW